MKTNNKKNRGLVITILFVLSFLFLVNLSTASLGNFNQRDCVPIVTNLNATSVTLNVTTSPTPNAAIILTNQPMTSNGNFFNYTFCNSTKVGTYTYGYCDNNGNCYSNDFGVYFWSLWFFLINGALVLIIIAFGINKEDVTIFALGNIALYFFAIFTYINGIDVYQSDMTRAIGLVLLGLAFYFSYKIYEGYDR